MALSTRSDNREVSTWRIQRQNNWLFGVKGCKSMKHNMERTMAKTDEKNAFVSHARNEAANKEETTLVRVWSTSNSQGNLCDSVRSCGGKRGNKSVGASLNLRERNGRGWPTSKHESDISPIIEDTVTIVDLVEQGKSTFQLCCDREPVLETRQQRELFEFLGASGQLNGTQWTN
ncbi:hypothetical protein K0M31_015401 [Melipona bicolor]|uniref:Uncharacterized protein n=1 Tax=Melipona bicolor TaxID=60889 RepID=A0AA40FFM3_9HYME|nr:hypothetical protein K0M31_015401 [Melipona bicolor]